jgi:flagellar biosynthesis/type III secretory pathway protein FliH
LARIAVTLWRCGKCGKSRGLHHLCTGRRKGRDRVRPVLSFTCPNCRKPTANPLTHTCSPRSDFRKRKAAQKRAERAAERKRKRKAAAARKRARARERKRKAAEHRKQLRAQAAEARRKRERSQSHDRNRHEYAACTDPYCPKFQCRVYREGLEAGRAEGHAAGFAEGYAEGMNAAYQSQ